MRALIAQGRGGGGGCGDDDDDDDGGYAKNSARIAMSTEEAYLRYVAFTLELN